MIRLVVIFYSIFHFWFDAYYDGSVKMQVMYHASHYFFVAGMALYSAKGSNIYKMVLTSISFVFIFFAFTELSYFYQTTEQYNEANTRAIDAYSYSFLLILSVVVLFLMQRFKRV